MRIGIDNYGDKKKNTAKYIRFYHEITYKNLQSICFMKTENSNSNRQQKAGLWFMGCSPVLTVHAQNDGSEGERKRFVSQNFF